MDEQVLDAAETVDITGEELVDETVEDSAAGDEEQAETGDETDTGEEPKEPEAEIDPNALTPDQRLEGALKYFPKDTHDDIRTAITLAEQISDPEKGLGFIPSAEEILNWKEATQEAVEIFSSLGAGSDVTLANMMVARDKENRTMFKDGKLSQLSEDGIGIVNAIGRILPNIPKDAQHFIVQAVTMPEMLSIRQEILAVQNSLDRATDKESVEYRIAENKVLDLTASFNALRKTSGLGEVSADNLIDPAWSPVKEPTQEERELARLRKEMREKEQKQSQRPVAVMGKLIDGKAAESLTELVGTVAGSLNVTVPAKVMTGLIEKALGDIAKRPALENDLKRYARQAAVRNDKESLNTYLSRLKSAVKPYLAKHITEHQKQVVEATTKAASKKVVTGQQRQAQVPKSLTKPVAKAQPGQRSSVTPIKKAGSPYDLMKGL